MFSSNVSSALNVNALLQIIKTEIAAVKQEALGSQLKADTPHVLAPFANKSVDTKTRLACKAYIQEYENHFLNNTFSENTDLSKLIEEHHHFLFEVKMLLAPKEMQFSPISYHTSINSDNLFLSDSHSTEPNTPSETTPRLSPENTRRRNSSSLEEKNDSPLKEIIHFLYQSYLNQEINQREWENFNDLLSHIRLKANDDKALLSIRDTIKQILTQHLQNIQLADPFTRQSVNQQFINKFDNYFYIQNLMNGNEPSIETDFKKTMQNAYEMIPRVLIAQLQSHLEFRPKDLGWIQDLAEKHDKLLTQITQIKPINQDMKDQNMETLENIQSTFLGWTHDISVISEDLKQLQKLQTYLKVLSTQIKAFEKIAFHLDKVKIDPELRLKELKLETISQKIEMISERFGLDEDAFIKNTLSIIKSSLKEGKSFSDAIIYLQKISREIERMEAVFQRNLNALGEKIKQFQYPPYEPPPNPVYVQHTEKAKEQINDEIDALVNQFNNEDHRKTQVKAFQENVQKNPSVSLLYQLSKDAKSEYEEKKGAFSSENLIWLLDSVKEIDAILDKESTPRLFKLGSKSCKTESYHQFQKTLNSLIQEADIPFDFYRRHPGADIQIKEFAIFNWVKGQLDRLWQECCVKAEKPEEYIVPLINQDRGNQLLLARLVGILRESIEQVENPSNIYYIKNIYCPFRAPFFELHKLTQDPPRLRLRGLEKDPTFKNNP